MNRDAHRFGLGLKENNRQIINIIIPQATDPNTLNIDINGSANMLDSLMGALPFLTEYPHGCTEQTLNRFLSSVVVLQTMEQLGIDTLTHTNAMPITSTLKNNLRFISFCFKPRTFQTCSTNFESEIIAC